ncbi:DUF935 domain-containing protein [Acinetobacter sp. c3-l95]|uniref:DUF935 domain-containing protein n=1 Tax=Acinetobacter sp. c3-l95 TaxID=3342804 RepID=UPI0035B9C7EF
MARQIDTSTSLAGEIASRERISLNFGGMTLSLPNPDPILKRMNKDIEVYREIMNDAAIKGATRRRRSAVVGLEYGLEQGDASDKVMQLCKQTLSRIKLRSLIRELHDGAWFGYSPAEVYWTKENGLWLPDKVIGKPPEWFSFDQQNQLCFKGQHGIDMQAVPEMKFILARNDATFNNPYGIADLAAVYWLAVFRKGGLKFWLRFADKYGQAFIVGKHPRATPDMETEKLLDSLELLSQNGVAAIPSDGSVEILEAAGKGATADMFERLLTYCRGEINIALLGQNQSSEASSTHAAAKAGLDVTQDIRDADGEMVEEAINDLLRYVVQLNIGDHEIMPEWSMWEEKDESERLANLVVKAHQSGATVQKNYFVRHLGFQDDEIDIASNPPPSRQSNLAFSEFKPLTVDYANTAADTMAQDAQPIVNDWLLRLKHVIDNATSLQQLQELIAQEFSELPSDKLVEVISMGLTAGTLAGMAQATAESEM